jgi:hypothetical protein
MMSAMNITFRRLIIITLLMCIAGFIQFVFAQSPDQPAAAGMREQSSYPIPIHGCMVLHEEEMKLQTYISSHPEELLRKSLQKQPAWSFSVGSTHNWWATNLVTNVEYSVPSTCKAVGTNAYIFVEDSLWAHGKVNQAAVDSVRDAFDLRCPANSSKGIYQMDVETFGNPPNVDSDSRIIILILDIIDGFHGSGGYVAGYFYSINEYPDPIGGHRSNYAEIYYIDGDPQNLTVQYYLNNAMSTTAHEFQHMIHWNYDPSEGTFVNESCSTGAEIVCGYSYDGQNLFTDTPDVYLLGWSSTLADYSRATRWSLYLWNQFTNGYLKLLVANTGTGITGMNNAFALYTPPTTRRFSDVFQDWTVANSLNDVSVDSRFGYTYSGSLTTTAATNVTNSSYSSGSLTVNRLGADYFKYATGTNLTATFTSGASQLLVRAIEVGSGSKRVVDVPLNTPWNEPAFGTTYTTITFDVANYSSSGSATYSLSSTYSLPGAPSAPTLSAPSNGAVGVSVTPTLSWSTSSGATVYHLQVSKSAGFSPLVYDDSTITATSRIMGTLGNDSTYYWRVRAGNTFGWSSFSSTWSFTTVPLPPAIPTLLSPADVATGISVTPTLAWNASSGATTYQIQVSKDVGFGTTVFSDSTITSTSQSVGPLGNDTTYYWRVRARNTGGWSGYATAWRFTTATSIPAVPVLLTPADLSTGIQVTPTLSWNASSGATAYQLQVSKVVGFGTTVFSDSTITSTSQSVGLLGNDTTYYWRVRAKNGSGWSGYSTAWSFTTIVAVPGVPVLLSPADLSTGIQLNPALSWNASSGATAYQLQVSKVVGFGTTVFNDSTITLTSQSVGPLGNDTTYYWRVRARNAGGWSGYSTVWRFTTIVALPGVPVLLAPADLSTGIQVTPSLSWNAASGATLYQLQLSKNAGFSTTVFSDSTIASTSRSVGPLGNDSTYYWRVRAKNGSGWSGYSAAWRFTTIVALPGVPVLLAPINGSGGVSITPTVSWNVTSGATGYHLQVSRNSDFSSLNTDDSTITGTSHLVGPLGHDSTYYWRVSAKNTAGWTGFSGAWSFTTVVALPDIPELLTPANGSGNVPASPILTWAGLLSATHYRLRVSKNSGFDTVVFDDSTITSPSKQIGALGNDTLYYWQVRAKNAAGWSEYSSVWSFTTIIATPNAPVLLVPADGSANLPVLPTLSWTGLLGTTYYRLRVSKNPGFSPVVFDDSTLISPSKQIGPLGNDTLYYWQVSAKNIAGWGGYSTPWSFTTIVALPQPPVLSTPANGSVDVSVSPTLNWIAVPGASTYRLQVAFNTGFTLLVFDDSAITATSRQVGPLADDTLYYWRVGAKNFAGPGDYSTVWSFRTMASNSVGHNGNEVPTEYRLGQNYPNPFNPSTTFSFELPEEAFVTIDIYDVMGRRLRTLLDVYKPAGYYHTVWDARDDEGREVSSGIYIYRFQAAAAGDRKPFTRSGKLILAK